MRKLIFLVALCSYACFTVAQEESNPWTFSSTNSVSYFSGNVDKFNARSESEYAHVDSTYEFSIGYLFHYGELRDKKYLVLHQGSVYYDYRPFNKFSPFASVMALSNEYKGFDLRLTSVIGGKYTIVREVEKEWSFSAGLLYDISDFADLLKGDEPTKESTEVLRLSVRPKIKLKIGEKASFKHFTFYQPSLSEPDDYLILSQSNFEVEVINHVSLSVGYFYNFNSRPAYERIKEEDQRLLLGVKIKI